MEAEVVDSDREKWEREFDRLAQDGGFIVGLAGSRKPNSAPPHDPEVHVARAQRWVSTIVDSLFRATLRLASSGK